MLCSFPNNVFQKRLAAQSVRLSETWNQWFNCLSDCNKLSVREVTKFDRVFGNVVSLLLTAIRLLYLLFPQSMNDFGRKSVLKVSELSSPTHNLPYRDIHSLFQTKSPQSAICCFLFQFPLFSFFFTVIQ